LFAIVDTELIGFAKVAELIQVVDTEIQVFLCDHFLLNSSLATNPSQVDKAPTSSFGKAKLL
jgi:hypothetical protein